MDTHQTIHVIEAPGKFNVRTLCLTMIGRTTPLSHLRTNRQFTPSKQQPTLTYCFTHSSDPSWRTPPRHLAARSCPGTGEYNRRIRFCWEVSVLLSCQSPARDHSEPRPATNQETHQPRSWPAAADHPPRPPVVENLLHSIVVVAIPSSTWYTRRIFFLCSTTSCSSLSAAENHH